MPPYVHDFDVPDAAREKLGRRGISVTEVKQLPWNPYEIRRDHRAPPGTDRRLFIGETDGGRSLTLVIEPTVETTMWQVVTGWQVDPRRLR